MDKLSDFLLTIHCQRFIFANSKFRLFKSLNFHIMNTIFLILFLIHTKLIWGIYTINPRIIYNQHDFVSTYVESLFLNLYILFQIIYWILLLFYLHKNLEFFGFHNNIFGLLFSILFFIKDKKISFFLVATFSFFF